jgi:hypothetical protein
MTISDIKAEHKRLHHGGHFFDADTMRFFRSRIGSRVFTGPGGIFFVTSEQRTGMDGTERPRTYTVRQFNPLDGDIRTVGEFGGYRTEAAAKAFAKQHSQYVASLDTTGGLEQPGMEAQ